MGATVPIVVLEGPGQPPTTPTTRRLPGDLDLDLVALVADLDLDRDGDLVGDLDRCLQPVEVEGDLVVAGELVGDLPQPVGGRFAAHGLLGLVLDHAGHSRSQRPASVSARSVRSRPISMSSGARWNSKVRALALGISTSTSGG